MHYWLCQFNLQSLSNEDTYLIIKKNNTAKFERALEYQLQFTVPLIYYKRGSKSQKQPYKFRQCFKLKSQQQTLIKQNDPQFQFKKKCISKILNNMIEP